MKRVQTRREFINTLSRGFILTGLLGVGGYLVLRRQDDDEACSFDFVCKDCKKVKTCSIPEAVQYKKQGTLK